MREQMTVARRHDDEQPHTDTPRGAHRAFTTRHPGQPRQHAHRRSAHAAWHTVLLTVSALLLAITPLLTFTLPTSAAAPTDADATALAGVWNRSDYPVAQGLASRTWMWGPALTAPMEEVADAASGATRTVQYFDKSRMEVSTDPTIPADSPWYITNGLLAQELVTGRMQTGPASFEQRAAADIPIAGDAQNTQTPTYATFNGLLGYGALPDGWTITQRVNRDGQVVDDPGLARHRVTTAHRVQVPGIDHQVASPFWEFMQRDGLIWDAGVQRVATTDLFESPFYATGYPITEAYWTTATIGTETHDVLVQVFERRVLTWTPDNPAAWRVESGNVGQHYYAWRYGNLPTTPGPAITPPAIHDGGHMATLQGQLNDLVGGWAGQSGVAVLDLQTGQMAGVNVDQQQVSACVVKIFIMMAVAEDIEAGKYTAASVDALVRDAMGPSNTWPARELTIIAGGGDLTTGVKRVNAIMQSLGMTRSVMPHPPGYPDVNHGFGTGEIYITARDMVNALGKLYRGEALSQWATDYVLWSMTIAIPGQQGSLGGGIPDSATLYHKIGLLYEPYNVWNDAGIVVFERNGREYAYAIASLSSGSGNWLSGYYYGTAASATAWYTLSPVYP